MNTGILLTVHFYAFQGQCIDTVNFCTDSKDIVPNFINSRRPSEVSREEKKIKTFQIETRKTMFNV